MALDANNPWLWNHKGEAHYELKQYAEAITCYDKSLALNPNDAVTWNSKGKVHSQLNQPVESKFCHDIAKECLPLEVNSPRWNKLLTLTHEHFNQRRYGAAAIGYELLLRFKPDVWACLEGPKTSYIRSGQAEKLLPIYQARLKANPNDNHTQKSLEEIEGVVFGDKANALWQQGNFAVLRTACLEMQEKYPHNARAGMLLAEMDKRKLLPGEKQTPPSLLELAYKRFQYDIRGEASSVHIKDIAVKLRTEGTQEGQDYRQRLAAEIAASGTVVVKGK